MLKYYFPTFFLIFGLLILPHSLIHVSSKNMEPWTEVF